jgi:hypothetical protein
MRAMELANVPAATAIRPSRTFQPAVSGFEADAVPQKPGAAVNQLHFLVVSQFEIQ